MLGRGSFLPGLVFACILLAAGGVPSAAGAEGTDIVIDGVPLPDDVTPLSPESSSSPFAGTWLGRWDGVIKTILVVEIVANDGTAQVVHAIEGNAKAGSKQSWARYNATVTDKEMTVHGRSAISYRLSKTGRLLATYGDGLGFSVLSRKRFKKLTKPDPEIGWSAGKTVFLETDLIESGNNIRLETVIYTPPGFGPFPLAVVSHGSTGAGTGAVPFTQTWTNDWFAEFLNQRGFIVAFPQRRGRGKSDGLYDEGFSADRTKGYTCEQDITLQGADRALTDLDAAIEALGSRSDVTKAPVLLAGLSRGGVLSVAFAGLHPDRVSGVVNFVGGWLGGCKSAGFVNRTLFKKGAGFGRPTLWIYGEDDTFYSMAHSRENFEAFQTAGGKGVFVEKTVRGKNNGHWVMSIPPLWSEVVSNYLDTLADEVTD